MSIHRTRALGWTDNLCFEKLGAEQSSSDILWNTVYFDRAIAALQDQGRPTENAWLQHISPVHWNHINLTGDYSWRQNKRVEKGGLRPLRMPSA